MDGRFRRMIPVLEVVNLFRPSSQTKRADHRVQALKYTTSALKQYSQSLRARHRNVHTGRPEVDMRTHLLLRDQEV